MTNYVIIENTASLFGIVPFNLSLPNSIYYWDSTNWSKGRIKANYIRWYKPIYLNENNKASV